jgi:hypothetical protein
VSAAEEPLRRAEQLLERLEAARAELEALADKGDTDGAIEVLARLAELARDAEAELQRARRAAGA